MAGVCSERRRAVVLVEYDWGSFLENFCGNFYGILTFFSNESLTVWKKAEVFCGKEGLRLSRIPYFNS